MQINLPIQFLDVKTVSHFTSIFVTKLNIRLRNQRNQYLAMLSICAYFDRLALTGKYYNNKMLNLSGFLYQYISGLLERDNRQLCSLKQGSIKNFYY